MAVEAETVEVHRWTPEEYHRLVESGGFNDDTRVELIDGLLVDMRPKTPAHEVSVRWLFDRLLDLGLDRRRYAIGVGAPLSLDRSEPEPDLIVFERSTPRPYHPATAELVIEVSLSSLRRDLRQKPPIYARANIPHYWVIDLAGRRAVVHSQPGPNGYARIETRGPGGALAAPHLGIASIELADLLAAARS